MNLTNLTISDKKEFSDSISSNFEKARVKEFTRTVKGKQQRVREHEDKRVKKQEDQKTEKQPKQEDEEIQDGSGHEGLDKIKKEEKEIKYIIKNHPEIINKDKANKRLVDLKTAMRNVDDAVDEANGIIAEAEKKKKDDKLTTVIKKDKPEKGFKIPSKPKESKKKKESESKPKEDKKIKQVVDYVKSQIGVDLKLDEHFSGLKTSGDKTYFNVDLDDRVSDSPVFVKLERLAKKKSLIKKVEQNGLKRVAVFIS